jgi:putative aldouronate transport system substrate-binding protein
MNQYMKKTMLAVLVAVVTLCAVSAQGDKEKGVAQDEPIVLCSADNTYGISTDPELQDSITEMIKRKTGVTVSPIVPPLASYKDKLATLINSGDIPDVFGISQAMVQIPQLVARGQVYDMTDFIKNSAVLNEKVDASLFKTPDTDGRYYFVPYNYPKAKGIFLRKDVMEKYGITLSAMPTTEEFRTEMKKLAGSGITPFTFPKWVDNFQFFYNSFDAWGGVYKKDGKFVDGFQTPEMKEALAYLHQLYLDGILNKEFITTENNQMREKTYTGQSASDIDYLTNYINYVQQTAATGNSTDMQIVYGLRGPKGDGGSLNEATQVAFMMSAKTKQPEKAFKVIETIVTDPELYAAFFGVGVEGKHYTLDADGHIQATDKARNSGYKYTLNYLSDSFNTYDLDNMGFKINEDLKRGIRDQKAIISASSKYLGPNHSADVPVGISDEYDRVSPSIKSTRESIATKIIVGTVTVDQGMEEYANFWKSIGGPKILDQLNNAK